MHLTSKGASVTATFSVIGAVRCKRSPNCTVAVAPLQSSWRNVSQQWLRAGCWARVNQGHTTTKSETLLLLLLCAAISAAALRQARGHRPLAHEFVRVCILLLSQVGVPLGPLALLR